MTADINTQEKQSVRISGIPDELKGYPQWVVWRFEQHKGDKKPRKVPYSPLTGCKTGTRQQDSHKWGTIEQAIQAAKTYQGRFNGIGFVFSQEDPFVGVDLDHCVTDGEPSELARTIIEKLHSFTEISPSGTGLHIFVKGKKPGNRCKRNLGGDQSIEVYDKERFFTVTGRRVTDTSPLINQDQEAFEGIYQEYVEQLTSNNPPPVRQAVLVEPVNLSDQELLDKISQSEKGAEFDRLFSGDMSAFGNDHSSADMSLCGRLAWWTNKDPERIDRLFRLSGLMREKWDSKRKDTTYGQITINKAIAKTNGGYQPTKNTKSNVVSIETRKKEKESKEKKSRKMRTCHITESAFTPVEPLFDPDNPPWPDTGSYYKFNPFTGDLHMGGSDTEAGEIIAQNPIWVHARTKDLHGFYTLVIKFFNYDSKEITVSFPTEALSDNSKTVGKLLRAQGMPLIAGKEKMVERYLDQMAKWCKRSGWNAEKIGWYEGTNPPCFVLPEAVLTSECQKEQVFYHPALQQDAKSITGKGSLKQWQEHVALPAKKNPLLSFGIMTGLAGPLNKLAKGEMGGFHFFGDTSCGKTAVAQGAASVWGDGSDPQWFSERTSIRKWKATVNGLEAYAQLHNDIVLCLDEMGGTKPEYIGEAIYLLTGGTPTGRSQVEGGIRKQPAWHNIIVSTGELTVEQIMRQAGQEQKGGQRHRMPDIRCDTQDCGVVADPKYTNRDERSKFIQAYKVACSQYYGTAGPVFVSWLLSQISGQGLLPFVSQLQTDVETYQKRLCEDIQVSDEGGRLMRRLAIIGVAAFYAAEIGILDTCPITIEETIFHVRDLWLEELGEELSEAERTLAYFKHQVLTNMSCFKNSMEFEPVIPRKMLGYQDSNYIMILVKSMDELCGMHSKKTVLRELEKQRKIELGELNKKTNKHRLDKKANLVHFKERPRCYHIHRDFFE